MIQVQYDLKQISDFYPLFDKLVFSPNTNGSRPSDREGEMLSLDGRDYDVVGGLPALSGDFCRELGSQRQERDLQN